MHTHAHNPQQTVYTAHGTIEPPGVDQSLTTTENGPSDTTTDSETIELDLDELQETADTLERMLAATLHDRPIETIDPFAALLSESMEQVEKKKALAAARGRIAFGTGKPEDVEIVQTAILREWQHTANVRLWRKHICPVCGREHKTLLGMKVRQSHTRLQNTTRTIDSPVNPALKWEDQFITDTEGQCGVCWDEGVRV